jgi:hypothetical protein
MSSLMPPTETLPFRLKVGKKEAVTWIAITTTRYRFQGFLQLADDALLLEWGGTAKTEEVGFLGIKSQTHALPHERLELPLEQLRGIELLDGWLRPRVELSTNFDALTIVPSEELGRVRLWVHRRDRGLARQLVQEIWRRLASNRLPGARTTKA